MQSDIFVNIDACRIISRIASVERIREKPDLAAISGGSRFPNTCRTSKNQQARCDLAHGLRRFSLQDQHARP